MRRTIFSIFGFLAIFAMLFTVSCSNEPEIVPEVEPVETFDKTVLTAIAYPGMNFISWTPVVDAKEYTLFKHEGNVCVEAISFDHTDALFHIDTEIKNGVEYSYLVEVELNSSSNQVSDFANIEVNPISPKQMSERASVVAIVPDYDISVLELVNYEQPSGNHEFIVSSDNICIAKHNNDKISVSFPSKAYLNYDLILTVDNEYETLKEYNRCDDLGDDVRNDVFLSSNFLVTQSGTYKARVVAKSENEHFGDSDIITSDDSVVVSKLNGHGAEILDAKYKNTYIGNTIRVQFSKFELENGSPVPKYYYKLYRSEKGSRYFTLVDATIHATDNTENKFFVDDYIYDNTKDYVYTLVVTDGSSYASSADKKEVESFTMVTQLNTVIMGEQVLDYLQWNIELPSSDVEINNIYILEKLLTDTEVVVPADFYSDGIIYHNTPELISDTLYTLKTEHAIGTKVYMMVTTTQNGKDSGEWLSDSVIRERDERIASFCDEQGDEIERSVLVEDEADSYWNELYIPAIPQRDEYVSLYWRDSNYNTYNPGNYTYLSNAETTFIPVYGRVAYFKDEYGNTVVDSIIVDNDGSYNWDQITLPEILSKSGYVALYWRDSNNNTYYPENYTYLSNAETTFTPVYGRVAYFKDEYGNTIADSITVTNDGSDFWYRVYVPEIPSKLGYTALYWQDSNYNIVYPGTITNLTSDETYFTAVYELFATTFSSTEWTIDNTNIDGKYYSFYAISGYSYTVSWADSYVNQTVLDEYGSAVDVKIYIYNPNGNEVYCGDDDGSYTLSPSMSGNYIIKVTSSSTGYFAVKVEETY